jgi:hypothetical protein
MIAEQKSKSSTTNTWQDGFLELLPRIEKRASVVFRRLDPEAREEAVTEVVANAACAYERLFQRGELHRAFASSLAKYAIAHYFAGRRTGSPDNSRDVYSLLVPRKACQSIRSTHASKLSTDAWVAGLVDNRQTSIPDQVSFRMDFPRWLAHQTPRNKRIAERLCLGYTTSEVSREFKISAGRISQLRRQLADSWADYLGSAIQH